ncbi:MAG: NADH:flavin oxidoreductase [Deltaproteobacteria bacterium]|nr:NADH:flavin oxidoreductase [Deltaproteobacteria bacterium]MBW2140812.1 NADH:flavin oxidoreductase [Deltaproteobacteria bacterium]MBW2324452.1 NADH:flavin oxidoreductase [Deltaproteobacteria bacterium]
MSVLFEPVRIGGLDIKNRFIRSAAYYALSDIDGFIGGASVDLMRTLAEGGVGLIMTGAAFVHENGQGGPDMNGIQDDAHIPGYQKMTGAVHEAGGRIAMQIVHSGMASRMIARSGGDYMAVSLVENMPDYGVQPREMNEDDIEGVIEAFGQAGRRVEEAGFDGVQIHGSHGSLISQFLSPTTNRRNDKWGGPLENRMRFVIEVVRSINKHVKEDFPVMIKLGARDYLEENGGLISEEGAEVGKALEEAGISLIEVSHGFQDDSYRKKFLGITAPEKEAYYLSDARVVRAATSGPLSLVGGLRSLPVMEEVVKSGVADCISICRPLIREPGLIKRWMAGDTRPADCIGCGGCFNFDRKNKKMHIYCRQLKKAKSEE